MYTDTHCHLFYDNYENLEEIISNLQINNIKRIIINGYNYETNLEVLKLTQKYDCVYGALGLHPNNPQGYNSKTLDLIETNLTNPKIIAIGEIGLDYYHNKENKDLQKEIFESFLKLAKKYDKPVIIHNRESTEDIIEILKKQKLKGIIHCFTGSYETAQIFIKLGYKLGINGILTFKGSKLSNTLKRIPIENILLETDAPYITPEPYRKEKNEPKYINHTAKTLAGIYNLTENELAKKLEKNFQALF